MKKQKKKLKPMQVEVDIGSRIYELRVARKLSQSEFANLVKISQSTVAQLESGRKDPSLSTLKKIARALDVDIATLFISENVHVFDLVRMRRKYTNPDEMSANLYMALGKVVAFAKDIGFI